MEEVEQLCSLLRDEARLLGEVAGLLCEERNAVGRFRTSAILACLEEREVPQAARARGADGRGERVGAPRRAGGGERERTNELRPLPPPAPQARLKSGLDTLRRALLRARGLERQTAAPRGALGPCW